MSPILGIVLFFILGIAAVETYLSIINLKNQPETLPDEFSDIYTKEKYATALAYHRENTRLSLLGKGVSTLIIVLLFLFGGFETIDQYVRKFGYGEVVTGLFFFAAIGILFYLLSLPFSLYSTFVIEERYGFNKTTAKTYILDTIKGALLSVLLGAPILAAILQLFISAGEWAWILCWAVTVIFSLFIQLIAPVVIMPLFNKFTPLEEGELKDKISAYAQQEHFTLKGIFTMDGSKRSTKLNAFFTGFGKAKKIALFDTLMEKLSDDEILGVLAHEVGHSKKGHIQKGIILSIIQTGIIFYLLSLLIAHQNFVIDLGINKPSIYASLFFFGYLFEPVNFLLGALFNGLSRKNEFEADAFAAKTTGSYKPLCSALKKLSNENMSNLSPHPLYVFFYYSHPPLATRLAALRKISL